MFPDGGRSVRREVQAAGRQSRVSEARPAGADAVRDEHLISRYLVSAVSVVLGVV